jgi:hypothetical protein
MKYTKTALVAAILISASHHPLHAQQRTAIADTVPETIRVQIAEVPALVRNVAVARKLSPEAAKPTGGDNVHPPGAQALMALGIALIVTPAMFRGAFSN